MENMWNGARLNRLISTGVAVKHEGVVLRGVVSKTAEALKLVMSHLNMSATFYALEA